MNNLDLLIAVAPWLVVGFWWLLAERRTRVSSRAQRTPLAPVERHATVYQFPYRVHPSRDARPGGHDYPGGAA